MPRLSGVCRKLGVDYACAMVGFEIRGGRSVPVFDGVVICEEHQKTVLDAYLEEERCAAPANALVETWLFSVLLKADCLWAHSRAE